MKVLVLTKYGDKGPSSRVRFLQYFPSLQEKGGQIFCYPLFGNEYIDLTYRGEKISKWYILKRYWLRMKTLCKARSNYDVIWLEAELFPYLPAFLENLFYKFMNLPVVVNYDDAIFHNYDLSKNILKKMLLQNKIKQVMKHAHTVVVGNRYLEKYAKEAGANHILRIPTVVDTKKYGIAINNKDHEKIRIGWIGTPSTAKYLKRLFPVFQKLAKEVKFILCVMGVDMPAVTGVEIKYTPWRNEDEIPFLQSLDIGIMPLEDTQWERGKCGYKLVQYMACGKPVIGTPIEINQEIIKKEENGLWASTEDEWLAALIRLCNSENLRLNMGLAGFKMVESNYSLAATSFMVFDMLKRCSRAKR